MLYKCLSFIAAIIPSTAKRHAGETYFKGTFMNNEDEWDIKDVNINFFPEGAARTARMQEWADTNATPDMHIDKINVQLPPFWLKDDAGNLRKTVYDSLDVYVRMSKNPAYVPGQTVEWIPSEDPKKKAAKTVESFGTWIVAANATSVGAKALDTLALLPPPAGFGFDPASGKPLDAEGNVIG